MEVISKKNLDKLIEMGFEVRCRMEGYIALTHKQHAFGIRLYLSDEKDDFQGVYMSIDDVTGTEIKFCKGRNVISNATRWIEMIEK